MLITQTRYNRYANEDQGPPPPPAKVSPARMSGSQRLTEDGRGGLQPSRAGNYTTFAETPPSTSAAGGSKTLRELNLLAKLVGCAETESSSSGEDIIKLNVFDTFKSTLVPAASNKRCDKSTKQR